MKLFSSTTQHYVSSHSDNGQTFLPMEVSTTGTQIEFRWEDDLNNKHIFRISRGEFEDLGNALDHGLI